MKEVIKEKGVVSSFNGSTVKIAINTSEACEECTAKLYCKPTSTNKNILSIKSKDKFKIGDSVEVVTTGKTVFLFTFFFYGIPLVILISTLLFSMFLLKDVSSNEFYSFVISLFLLTIYYTLFNKFIKQNTKFFSTPTIVKTDNYN